MADALAEDGKTKYSIQNVRVYVGLCKYRNYC